MIKTFNISFSILIFWLFGLSQLCAQAPPPVSPAKNDQNRLSGFDTLSRFSKNTTNFGDSANVQVLYSPDSLDAVVDYSASDSIVLDNVQNLVYLYGNAIVKYGSSLQLKADHIVINLKDNIALAEGKFDSLANRYVNNPQFEDGEQNFRARKMRYNFKTRKGLVYDVTTKQKDIFLHGSQTKFVAANRADSAKIQEPDVAYSRDAIFTTCNAEHPHFGIHSFRQKIIANKLIVVGPSNVEFGGVPTPFWLPFGVFPLNQGKSSGLIFPQNYTRSPAWGFGFQGVGYYFPLGATRNLQLLTDFYFNGTVGVNGVLDYRKIYKNTGQLKLGYFREITEDAKAEKLVTPRYSFKWSHQQDRAAHPNQNFSTQVDFETGGFSRLVNNDFRNVTKASANSSIQFSKSFPNSPFSFTADIRAGQNLANRSISLQLPNLNLQMQQINPFRRKARIGDERWYEKLVLRYNSTVQNQINTSDSVIFKENLFKNAQFGVKHSLQSDAQIRLGGYFNITPSVNYSEFWYLKSMKRTFDNVPVTKDLVRSNPITGLRDTIINGDTTANGRVQDVFSTGFTRVPYLENVGVNFSVAAPLFGKLSFSKRGKIRALRHTVTGVSMGLQYRPDYSKYLDSVEYENRQTRLRQVEYYNRFERNSLTFQASKGTQLGVSYGFQNQLELKYWSKRDSIEKKIKLLDVIGVSGFYNAVADSFKMQPMMVSTSTRLFRDLVNVQINAEFDFYKLNEKKYRTEDRTAFLPRFAYFAARATGSISIGQIKSFFKPKNNTPPVSNGFSNSFSDSVGIKPSQNRQNANQNEYEKPKEESFSDLGLRNLFDNFSVGYAVGFERRLDKGADTSIFTLPPLVVNGSIPLNLKLTKNWSITTSFGFDFKTLRFSYPDISFLRELHCWQMGANWQPDRGTYGFFLRVKPGSFDFLKVPYNKNRIDAVR